MPCRRRSAGFSLVELLIVIAVMGILAAVAMPTLNPGIHDQLQAMAQVLEGDLAYGRSLAVANNSSYRLSFDMANNRYVLRHSGSDSRLDELPDSPFRSPSDPPEEHIVELDRLPRLGGHNVRLAGAGPRSALSTTSSSVEFGPLGETTASEETQVWLAAGSGAETRFLFLSINPVTGLASIGDFTSVGPASAAMEASSLEGP